MGEAYFYHLTRAPLETALPQLLALSLKRGWRVAVRGGDAARLDWLDRQLWLGPDDGFLPHGLAGGPHDADQPILLTTDTTLPNGATCLMAVDGAAVAPQEVQALERVCILFDGADPAALQHARTQWRNLTGAGCAAKYWAQGDGGWVMKAESKG